jgi:hypothetical protein
MASNAAFASEPSSSSSSGEASPLASEGDWSAYPDESTGEIYYFNHDTGESSWDPPTPTFPAIVAASSSRVGGVSGNKVGAAWAGDAAAATMASSTTAPWPGGDVDYDDGGGGAAMDADDGASMPRGDGPPPQGGPFGRQMQQQRQQQRPPTFYEILRVSPMATRSQIKLSYQSLVKGFDQRNGGEGRRSREFNDVARAYMVLSDERTREKYDRQLEMEEAQRRMRYKMMEEERSWREEERINAMRMGMGPMDMGMGMDMDDPDAMMRRRMEEDRMMAMRMGMGGGGMGVDDANAMMRRQQMMGRVRPNVGNKFTKDAGGDGTNMFDGGGWQQHCSSPAADVDKLPSPPSSSSSFEVMIRRPPPDFVDGDDGDAKDNDNLSINPHRLQPPFHNAVVLGDVLLMRVAPVADEKAADEEADDCRGLWEDSIRRRKKKWTRR